jgi:hypothetical protein
MTIGERSDPIASPAEVAAAAHRVLEANWTEGRRGGVRFAYTRPSPGRYPWQWYWDSCFAAIVWRRFDPARSRAELETLLGAGRCSGSGRYRLPEASTTTSRRARRR